MEHNLGDNIRRLRKAKSMTLNTLAVRTGLTVGYMSKIERNLTNPPIATVSRIASALNVRIADLFGESAAGEVKVSLVQPGERKAITRDGELFGYYYESLAHKMPLKLMEPFIITLIPHAKDKTFFQHGGEEMMFVLEGTIELTHGESRYLMEQGSCIYFDASISHRCQCVGDKEAKALVVVSSPTTNGR